MSSEKERGLSSLHEQGKITPAGDECTYCREEKPCRPSAVVNREHIPALCDECFMAIREAGRYDVERDREVFHP